MTGPDDPYRWGDPEQADGSRGGQAPQDPVTGSTVSYNAAAFDDERRPPGAAIPQNTDGYPGQQNPSSGQYPVQQNPASGSFAAPGPVSGSFAAPGPTSGSYGQHGPTSGAYPAAGPASGSFGAPTSGSYPAQPGQDAISGGYPTQSGYGPPSGSYPVQGGPFGGGGQGPTKKSNKPLLLGLGGLVVVALLVVGYFVFFSFSGIHNAKGDIKNAKSFLSQAESTWKDSLPDDGITPSKKPGCYYVLGGGDDITNQIACGPVRRAASEKGAVWDFYHFTTTGSGDNQQATELTDQAVGKKEPKNGSLVNADGDGPDDDGADLKEPPLPKADKDGVWTVDQFTVDAKSKGDAVKLDSDPRLVAPGAQVVINSITEYSMATIDGKAAQAADGQRLVVVELTGDAGPVNGYLTNVLAFDLNGTKVETDSAPDSLGATKFLVSVPAKGKSSLVLDSEGHQQSLDLASGERAEDKSTELYYSGTPEPTTSLSDKLAFPATAITPTEAFSLNVTFADAKLTPYDAEYGWAPAGQHWLIVTMSTDGVTSAASSSFQYYSIDCSATTVSGGTMKSCKSDAGTGQTATLVAAVTPGTKQFSVSFAATLDAWGTSQPDAYGGFGPAPVAINFP